MPVESTPPDGSAQRVEQQKELYARTLRDTVRQLEDRTRELSLVRELGSLFERSTRLDDLTDFALPMFLETSRAENASILLHNAHTDELVLVAALSRAQGRAAHFGLQGYDRRMFARGQGLAGWCLAQGEAAFVRDTTRDVRFLPDPARLAVGCVACIPLTVEGNAIGVVNISHPSPGGLDETRVRVWNLLAGYVAIGVAQARLFQELRDANRGLERQVRARTQHLEATNRDLSAARAELARSNEDLQHRVHERTVELEDALAELQARHAELTEAHRVKDEFLNNVNHELKTPLNAVIGCAGLLLRDLEGRLSDEERDDLALIEANGRHLQQILENIFSLKDIEAGDVDVDREPTDLDTLVASAVASVRPRSREKGIEMTFTPVGSLPSIQVDPTLIRRVLFNLLDNAVKFSSRGEIQVATRLDHRDPDAPARALASSEGGHPFAVIEVGDQGRGIREEDADRIFQKFQQAEPATQKTEGGSGLGLTIAKNLVELHGGRIWVTSRPDEGSTFSFALPLGTPLPSETGP